MNRQLSAISQKALDHLIKEVVDRKYADYLEAMDKLHPTIVLLNEVCDAYKETHCAFYSTYSEELAQWFRDNRARRIRRSDLEIEVADMASVLAAENIEDGESDYAASILANDEHALKCLVVDATSSEDYNANKSLLFSAMYDRVRAYTDEELEKEAEDVLLNIYKIV